VSFGQSRSVEGRYFKQIVFAVLLREEQPRPVCSEKTLSAITSGLATGTPLTLLLKTLTWPAATVEAAMVASAKVAATSEQDLACSKCFKKWFHDLFGVRVCLFGLRGNSPHA